MGSLPKSQQPFNTKSTDDLLAFLNGQELEENDCFICVIINNIDGPGLRESETQQILARFSSCSNIRVVASIDHVNAPLCKPIFSKMLILFELATLCLFCLEPSSIVRHCNFLSRNLKLLNHLWSSDNLFFEVKYLLNVALNNTPLVNCYFSRTTQFSLNHICT